jgi:hypothetical protein
MPSYKLSARLFVHPVHLDVEISGGPKVFAPPSGHTQQPGKNDARIIEVLMDFDDDPEIFRYARQKIGHFRDV